jgi:glyoxylase-like metal-dependent hydrolase (beta-lactamase superfamily II)
MIERIIVGELYVNCYIYFTGRKECFLIDPGADAQIIIKRLSALNMTPRALVFTHGHLDHIAAALELHGHFAALENKLAVAVHKADGCYFGKNAQQKHLDVFASMGGEALFESIFRGVPKTTTLLEEGEIVPGSDLTVIHTPGHTKGSVCLYNESKKIMFTGDTLFCEGVGRSDLPGGDPRALEASILKKLYTLPPETRIFPGHGPQSTLEREMNYNPFIRSNN